MLKKVIDRLNKIFEFQRVFSKSYDEAVIDNIWTYKENSYVIKETTYIILKLLVHYGSIFFYCFFMVFLNNYLNCLNVPLLFVIQIGLVLLAGLFMLKIYLMISEFFILRCLTKVKNR